MTIKQILAAKGTIIAPLTKLSKAPEGTRTVLLKSSKGTVFVRVRA